MLHIYTGDGKGKTTAAVGLALRAAGAKKRVLFFQFLKSDTSSERAAFRQIKGITVVDVGEEIPFLFGADEENINHLKELYRQKTDYIYSVSDDFDMFVFDEAICAIDCGIVDKSDILRFKDKGELVLTGRGDIGFLAEHADYITEMKKIKHPYDAGCSARGGIEY